MQSFNVSSYLCNTFCTKLVFLRLKGVSGSAISIHNLADVVNDQSNVSGTSDYFDALCRQSYPGPLVGGNAAAKDVHKWIDERIKSCESLGVDFQKSKLLKLLLSLLKISCQHYGKLRSPFGSDPSLEVYTMNQSFLY